MNKLDGLFKDLYIAPIEPEEEVKVEAVMTFDVDPDVIACDCGSDLCTYPGSFHCRHPV